MGQEKNIPFKNYVILAGVLILSIAVIIYFYMWYGEIIKNKIGTPVMNEYLNVINYNELDDYLIENKDVNIYVSILDNENTRDFEKKFKRVINNYSLNNNMLYMNLTNESNKDINNFMIKYDILSLPCVISFRNGKVFRVYEIASKKYDIDLLISYFRIEGIIND